MIEFNEAEGIYTLDKIRPEVIRELDHQHTRIGPLKWKKGRPKPSDAYSAALAVTSGFADDETVKQRMDSCLSCPGLLKTEDGIYCGVCRCGNSKMARLDGTVMPKLRWRRLLCPLGRPGFSEK